MKYQNKRVALKFATFAAIFGLMCLFMDMMEENEQQTTYSVTLEDLALGNGETNGESGGAGGGGADGESGGETTGGGGTTIRNGYNDIIITRISQKEVKDVNRCTFKTRTREGLLVTCDGRGSLSCTPGLSSLTPWSSWTLKTKDEDGCQ